MTLTRRVTASLASSRGLFLTAVAAGALCCVGFLGVGGPGHILSARFTDADGLVVGNDVRVAGVTTGSVTSVQFGIDPSSGQQYAQVDMEIDSAHWPLHEGTKISVKPKGVLSNVFVELDPGSIYNPPLGDHPYFNLDQTQSPVNLDQLNNVFTPDVRSAIRTQLQQGVLAFGGSGAADLNQTLANANPLTADLIPVVDVLATRSPQLDRLNFEFDTISGDLAREDANLRPLIANLDTTFSAVAGREADLQGTLTQAAGFFTELSQALQSTTTQADLARVFQQGPEALACASTVGTYLTPLIAAVNPYISYTSPLSLDSLLNDFVTASGFNWNTVKLTPPASGDALRVDPIVPDPSAGFVWHDTGGLTLEHSGHPNAQVNAHSVYEEQPAITSYPRLGDCTPVAGLP